MQGFAIMFGGIAFAAVWLVLFLPGCFFLPWRSAALLAAMLPFCSGVGTLLGLVPPVLFLAFGGSTGSRETLTLYLGIAGAVGGCLGAAVGSSFFGDCGAAGADAAMKPRQPSVHSHCWNASNTIRYPRASRTRCA